MSLVEPRVAIGVEANALRRGLGPTAWLVFEELILSAQPGSEAPPIAVASVRMLAARTGLATGTVARALTRLRREGLATSRQARGSGVFASGSYELVLPLGVSMHWTVSEPNAPVLPRRRQLGAPLTLPIES